MRWYIQYAALHFNSLTDKWSPALQIRTVLLSIQALLSAPNPDDPLANDVADQWKTNEAHAIETGYLIFFCDHYGLFIMEVLVCVNSSVQCVVG